MNEKLETGKTLILKKDFPPYPIGTEFTISYGIGKDEMILSTPRFGSILPNGEKIPSSSVKTYYEYAKIFEKFGGWLEWFDIKSKTEIEEWSSHCIKFKGEPISQETINQIKLIIR